jgi:hypothetical protein
MKVYALYDEYFNGCESLEWLVDLYLNYEDAMIDQIKLEEINKDPGQTYNIRELSVK